VLSQDKALVATDLEVPGVCGLKCHVFAVFDGHNGGKTAKYCKDNLLDELLPRLPMEEMPPESRKEEFQVGGSSPRDRWPLPLRQVNMQYMATIVVEACVDSFFGLLSDPRYPSAFDTSLPPSC
jgi:hypothetical protein